VAFSDQTGARILVVDDDPTIRTAVCAELRLEGFATESADDGEAALAAARSTPYDLVILDLGLPRLAGTEVCRRLRSESDVPILVLSARGGESDRVLLLEAGADDYVTKPFSPLELVSRVRAILRRRELDRGRPVAVRVGELALDFARHEVLANGDPVHLTQTEFQVLALLARDPGRVVTRRQIMEELWRSTHVGDQRAAYVHISNLRHKLERDPARPERIVTVRGVGYKLVAGSDELKRP
jgi:DNA-binding response OmpR family regulator